jgi:hypothetical protein
MSSYTRNEPGRWRDGQMGEQIERVKSYLAAREAVPMLQLGDGIHTVNAGSEFEGELRLSDLKAFVAAHELLVKAFHTVLEGASADVSDTAIIVGSDAKSILAFARMVLSKATA